MCKTSDGTDIAAASIVEQLQRGWPRQPRRGVPVWVPPVHADTGQKVGFQPWDGCI